MEKYINCIVPNCIVSDIQYDIQIIQNLIQSGMIDKAFLEYDKIIKTPELNFDGKTQLDLIYARLLLELGDYEKSYEIMERLNVDRNKLQGEMIRLAIDVYYSVSLAFTGKLEESFAKIVEIENYLPKMKKINFNNSKPFLAEIHNTRGVVFFRTGKRQEAIEEYSTSIKLSKELNLRKDEARTTFNLASLYDQAGDHNQAIKYFQKSLEIFESIKFYEGIIPSLKRLKSIYQRLGDSEKEFDFDRKLLDYQLHMELRSCKITNSRLNIELNNQIASLISERNQLEQKIWNLEFRMNSDIASNSDLANNIDRIASDELDKLIVEMNNVSEDFELTKIELDNMKRERDELKEQLSNQSPKVDDSLIEELNALKSREAELVKLESNQKDEISKLQSINSELRSDMELLQIKKKINETKEELLEKIEVLKISLSEKEKNVKDILDDLDNLKQEKSKVDKKITVYQTQIKNLETKLRETQDVSNQSALEKQKQEIQGKFDDMKKKFHKLEKEKLNLSEELKSTTEKFQKNKLQDQIVEKLEIEITALKKEIEGLKQHSKESENLVKELKLEKEKYMKLKDEYNRFISDNSLEVNKAILAKDKQIIDLRVRLSKYEKEETEQKAEELETDKILEEELSEPTTSSMISSKVAPISQTVRPSQLLKKQGGLPKSSVSKSSVGRVFHSSLPTSDDNLSDYLAGDKLAQNVHDTIKDSGSIQLRFLAMRLSTSMPKCQEIVNNLDKLGVVKISYSEGQENNPKITYKT